ncbi:malto-oligosyltrehalose trehalohydrolase [soil metagenome]
MSASPLFGALPDRNGTRFRIWAPKAESLYLVIEGRDEAFKMEALDGGVFELFVSDVTAGDRYRYRVGEGEPMPDYTSRFQPEGVHGPSEIVDPNAFDWSDADWKGVPQEELVFYELHIGTFSPEGTYDGVTERLQYLRGLGITAIELMPVADFPGRWNWGYDNAALYAPSRAYGTPDDLRRLVDGAHKLGMAVYLDVVYNHLGPDGAYFPAFAPVFTKKHKTPWGQAINLDDRGSEGVRQVFIDNVMHWLREYHVDGLRLDATHALVDDSERHFIAELSDAVAEMENGGWRRILVAEDHRNLNTLIQPTAEGGFGIDAVWADDLHHQIRNITAGDSGAYYADYADSTAQDLAVTVEQGWFYDGRPSRVTGKPRGTSADPIAPDQCVVCIQNHDQVGNRPVGDRLTETVSPEHYRAASALLLFAPELPLLFMGQEWGATSPFLFFTDHNEELGPLVSKGRKSEFKDFPGFSGEVPDPQDPQSFQQSKLRWNEQEDERHGRVLALYRALLALRRDVSGGAKPAAHGDRALHVKRGPHHLFVTFEPGSFDLPSEMEMILHTEQSEFAADPVAPSVADNRLHFQRAGAAIFRQG